MYNIAMSGKPAKIKEGKLTISEVYVLVTDSRSGNMLEINSSEAAAIEMLGPNFLYNVVRPYIKNTSIENLPVIMIDGEIGLNTTGDHAYEILDQINPTGNRSLILFPQFAGYGRGMSDDAMDLNQLYPHVCIVNASRLHQALFQNKAFLTEVAQDAGTEHMPLSKNYLHPKENKSLRDTTICSVMADFAGQDYVVLKRIDGYQGQGIMVVDYNEIPATLDRLLGIQDSLRKQAPLAEQGWDAQSMSIFQVQSFAPGTIVGHRSHEWSATTRILWSVIIGEDEDGKPGMDVKAHGGFYKLPRDPISQGVTQNNTISFSHSQGPLDYAQSLLARWTGRGSQIPASESDLKKEIALVGGDLEKLFLYAGPHDITSLAGSFENSADPVRQMLSQQLICNKRTAPEGRRGRIPTPREKLVPELV